MKNLQLKKEETIKKITTRKLIINDKVVNYLFNKINKKEGIDLEDERYALKHFLFSKITKDMIKTLLEKNDIYNNDIVIMEKYYDDYDNEREKIKTHLVKYNEDDINGFETNITLSIYDLLHDYNGKLCFENHPENFDFENEVINYYTF